MLTENLHRNCLGLPFLMIFYANIVGFNEREIGLFPPLIDLQVCVEFGFQNLEAEYGHINFLLDVVVEDVI